MLWQNLSWHSWFICTWKEKPLILHVFSIISKGRREKKNPFQLFYCIFPIMSDMLRSLSVRQLWRIIQLWSVHPYQSHIHLLGYCKSVTGNDLGDIVTKQSLRTQPLMKWMLCTFFFNLAKFKCLIPATICSLLCPFNNSDFCVHLY